MIPITRNIRREREGEGGRDRETEREGRMGARNGAEKKNRVKQTRQMKNACNERYRTDHFDVFVYSFMFSEYSVKISIIFHSTNRPL